MGAALTQRPELFRAVVCQVPLLDMLRYQQFQIAKLWIPEYGSSDDPEQFEYLYAYSPYHHVKPVRFIQRVLFMTAESDTRVDPMHAVKMAALLQAQAANGADRPILLRVDSKGRARSGQADRKTGGRRRGRLEFFVLAAWREVCKPSSLKIRCLNSAIQNKKRSR